MKFYIKSILNINMVTAIPPRSSFTDTYPIRQIQTLHQIAVPPVQTTHCRLPPAPQHHLPLHYWEGSGMAYTCLIAVGQRSASTCSQIPGHSYPCLIRPSPS